MHVCAHAHACMLVCVSVCVCTCVCTHAGACLCGKCVCPAHLRLMGLCTVMAGRVKWEDDSKVIVILWVANHVIRQLLFLSPTAGERGL